MMESTELSAGSGEQTDGNSAIKQSESIEEHSNKFAETKGQQNSSKLESLSRADLIKLVKKQLLNQKELKRQLEAAKKEAEENGKQAKDTSTKLEQSIAANDGANSSSSSSSMLMVELNDYKNAIGIVRKELQECKERNAEKESLIEELSQRIAQLQQAKEETHEELRRTMGEAADLRQAMEEKSRVIGENSKEISALLVQLNESRQGMAEEIGLLQEKVRAQGQELAAERRTDSARGAELKRLRCENDTVAQRLANMEEEFANYRERAEYALKKSKDEMAATVSATNSSSADSGGYGSGEMNQLMDILRQRNAQISQLSAKCSFLEEEVRSGQEHAKTLVDELNALHDSITEIRQQAQAERRRLGQEWEQRLRGEETRRGELERELRVANEREMEGATVAAQNQLRLRMECERMTKELEEARRKMSSATIDEKSSPSPSKNGPQQHKVHQRPQRHKIPPLNISSTRPTANTAAISSGGGGSVGGGMNESLDMDEEEEEGLNSESSNSLEDLQSMLQEAEIAPSSDVPTFNVASLGEEGATSVTTTSALGHPYQQEVTALLSEEQFHELQKQLVDCRDLLSESEETNVRLTEQINVLKDEIRRMERNQKRAEHLGNGLCSEYFKNIVLKFLAPPKVNDERIQLLPVLQTILHLDGRELDLVRKSCAAAVQPPSGSESGIGSDSAGTASGTPAATGNGAALMDWSSLFGWK